MSKLTGKIRKLQKALEMHGRTFLCGRRQIYSEKLGKVCTIFSVDEVMTYAEWQRRNPGKKKYRRPFVRENVLESFKEIDILMALVAEFDKVKGGADDG